MQEDMNRAFGAMTAAKNGFNAWLYFDMAKSRKKRLMLSWVQVLFPLWFTAIKLPH